MHAQAPSATQSGAQPAPAPSQTQAVPAGTQNQPVAPMAPVTASALLQPALTETQTTLNLLKLDKWKKGSVRDEAGENVNALLRDLQTNLPPLMTAADASPTALSQAIPLIKHLDAFYDVLLRVEEASRVSAPSEQVSALQQLLLSVNKARIAYDDLLQAQAASHEKQAFALQTELQAQKETIAAQQAKATAVAATPCKPATPAHKKRRSAKSATKPGAGTPAAQKPQ